MACELMEGLGRTMQLHHTLRKHREAAGIAAALITLTLTGISRTANAQTIGASYNGSYNVLFNASIPGVPTNYGGVTFLNSSTLLVGGAANGGTGSIQQIGVTRDGSGHINGFTGSSTLYATAPNIDGGLLFGPGGVLFATTYSNNSLHQYKPGSTSPDRTDALPSFLSSTGSLGIVPTGFGGVGNFYVVSYSTGAWGQLTLTPDGNGTYNISVANTGFSQSGGPEGIVYVYGGNPNFTSNSVLVSEYGLGQVASYQVDANGLPILATRQVFVDGLSGAEGGTIDPLTGDFVFSTFGGGNKLVVVSGFTVIVPEPGTIALLTMALPVTGVILARRRKK